MSVCWGHTPIGYSTSTIPLVWKVAHANATVDASNGYDSTPALTASSNGAFVKQPVFDVGNPSEVSRGARVMVSSFPAAESILFGVTDSNLDVLLCVTILPSGKIAVYRGELADFLGVSADPIATATQHRLAFLASLTASGHVDVQLDGESLTAASGVDLTGSWAGVYVGCHQNIYISYDYGFDDLIARPDWLCDVVLSSHNNLDDADVDGDATIVPLDVGDRFDSPIASVTTRRAVYGVMTRDIVKSVGSPRGYARVIQVDGLEILGTRRTISADEYQAADASYPLNPRTNLPWETDDELANIEVGGEVQV